MKDLADKVDWEKGDGLVPAIVQDAVTARVLMLGYMNREALAKTIESGNVTFFSRSKQRLWMKGESSGNVLALNGIKVDCDNDTLLVKALPAGPTCHKGTETCFGEGRDADIGFLGTLETIIASRKDADPDSSYVASLLQKGVAKMAQKVGEEGVETALAATIDDDTLKDEAADLVFHLLVLLQAQGLSLRDIADVLEKRHN